MTPELPPEPGTGTALSLPTAGSLLDTGQLADFAAAAQRRGEKLTKMLDELEKGIAARAEKVRRALADTDFPADQVDAAATREAKKARAELHANSEDARWEIVRELHAAAEAVAVTDTLFQTPAQVLSRVGLDDPRRANLYTTLKDAGDAELGSLAIWAAARGDRVLGAVVAGINNERPRARRRFSSNDLAERLVGQEFRAVRTAIDNIRTVAQAALNANREFATGRARPVERLRLALANRKEA